MHPFLDWPGPIPFAHRGGAGDHPENTMPAFGHAVELGYRYLETDAHCSRDGIVFAFHDDVLERVTDGRGRLTDLPAAEIEAADAGYSFTTDGGRTFPWRGRGVRIPRMEELLETWPSARVNLDTKSDAVVEPLIDLLRRMNVLDRVCIGSFSDERLVRVRRLSEGRACTSMGPRALATARLCAWARWMPRQSADCVQMPVRSRWAQLANPSMIESAHRAGLPVHIWTIDDEAQMDSLLDLGVDGLMTDRPAVLRSVLTRRGQWHE